MSSEARLDQCPYARYPKQYYLIDKFLRIDESKISSDWGVTHIRRLAKALIDVRNVIIIHYCFNVAKSTLAHISVDLERICAVTALLAFSPSIITPTIVPGGTRPTTEISCPLSSLKGP